MADASLQAPRGDGGEAAAAAATRSAGGRDRRRLALAVWLLALVWVAYGLGVETLGWHRRAVAPRGPGLVAYWRLGEPRAASLGGFLDSLRAELPDGAVVVFTSDTGMREQDFYLSLWTAYLLPRQRVLPLERTPDLAAGDYLVAYNTAVDDPRLEPVARRPQGRLYRIVR